MEELKLLGLNDIDIKVYLTLLGLGESLASEIAKKCEIPRASIYDILERLEKEGLVSYIIKDYKKYFSSADPKTIIKNLEYKRQRLKEILPKLEEIKKRKTPETIKTEIFIGKKGIQTVMDIMLEEKRELFVMGASRLSSVILPYYLENWHRERIKRKIRVKIIYNDTEKIRESLDKKETRESLGVGKGWNYRFLHVHYLSPIMTIVFGNKTALINWTEIPSLILIDSEKMSKSYKNYFEVLWRISKR